MQQFNTVRLAFALAVLVTCAPFGLAMVPGAQAAPVDGVVPWTQTCSGFTASGGVAPQLSGLGPLTPQSFNSFELMGAPVLHPAVFVLGLSQIAAPFKGGTLCPEPLLLLQLGTDVNGTISLPFVLSGVPAGLTAHGQFWIPDEGPLQGYSSSNGLKLVTQPAPPVAATLRYVARHQKDPKRAEHMMGVEAVLAHHALVSTNLGLKLIDLDAQTAGGSTAKLALLTGLDCTTTVTRSDGYVYVNLRMGGLAVVRLDAQALTLGLLTTISEPGVYYEKMCLNGDRLYVAAHAFGIRIFSLANPAAPQLVGTLTEGFSDAWAIAVSGHLAYVADGDGGLKVVDITDEAAPLIVFSEDAQATLGAAEDAAVIGSHVYVAHGSSGVAVHALANPALRTLHDTPICAKHLGQAGSWLGVADIGGFEVFAIQPDGSLVHAARERALYRSHPVTDFSLRLWHGIDGWGANRFLVADWDTVDLYDVVNPQLDSQPDIMLSTQRIRFAPAGGSAVVQMSNAGAGVLQIASITASVPSFGLSASAATLQPGQSLPLTITYAGGQPGSGTVLFQSNDPDEALLPVQVFGETNWLDPGDPAIPFMLPAWTFDHATKAFLHDTFDLDAVNGQVVFFQAFATW